VMLLALLRPDWLTATALIVVVIGDLSFFRDVSISLRNLVRKNGTIPYRFRYPFFPFAAGFIAYGAISFGYISTSLVPVVAIAAAALIAVSKLWISTGPLWPYAAKGAAA
jgi:hypothetical protein